MTSVLRIKVLSLGGCTHSLRPLDAYAAASAQFLIYSTFVLVIWHMQAFPDTLGLAGGNSKRWGSWGTELCPQLGSWSLHPWSWVWGGEAPKSRRSVVDVIPSASQDMALQTVVSRPHHL